MATKARKKTKGFGTAILGVGLGAGLVYLLFGKKKPPTPPPGYANLYGRVIDAITGNPIPDVLVTLDGMQVYTDAKGDYAFTDLEPGAYTITFEKEGYETATF